MAQDLPPEDDFTITSTAAESLPPVAVGAGREFGIYESLLTATNAEGSGLLHNMTGRCLGWFLVDTKAGTYEQHGQCAHGDADGDVLWESFAFEPQPLADLRIATGPLARRHRQVRRAARRARDPRALPPPAREAARQSIGTKQGSYRIAR